MDRRSTSTDGIDGGRLVVAAGAILLLVALFIDWYGFDQGPEEGVSAWTIFEIVDLLLAVIALAAIASALESVFSSARLPDTRAKLGAALGPIALVIVATSLINKPALLQEAELQAGAWLALAGAAIMCAGALLATNRVSLVIAPRDRPGETTVPSQPQATPREAPLRDETETQQLPPR